MNNNSYKTTALTDEDKSFLKSKTPFSLPDNPSDKGFSAEQIKQKMYEGYLVIFEWLKRMSDEVNLLVGNIDTEHNSEIANLQGQITSLSNYVDTLALNMSKYDENGNRIIETYATKADYVPKTTTINNKALSSDITLNDEDIGLQALTTEELSDLYDEA